ncbi:butyrophilin subfamily 1 member A1 [Alligator mississippiensis]|uniref:butyrophilin subfamily 1 member A1 n=1 Tax=Alligator mississippiensis TaxID=8496 RepID=UPI0028778DDC|nr:butyrophilin subfamily 1 member A1 [Alligator mississippiensis]XP_059571050.1 butyrophilin subfamily 1 member A1 [Alligator mississippiensis]
MGWNTLKIIQLPQRNMWIQSTMKKMTFLLCHISRPTSLLHVLIIFCFTLKIHQAKSAQFTAVGPDQPVTAVVGQEIVLPCHLSPNMNAQNMEVRWFRSAFDNYVHLYRNGKDQYTNQILEYQRRTALLKDDMVNGNVPLRILNITRSDEGEYHCFIRGDTSYAETKLDLEVAGLGSAPLISVEDYQDGGIRVVCRSAGWYPVPEVLWRHASGQQLPSLSETKSQKGDGLFETENSIIIKHHSNQNLSCCIRNNFINQTKESAVYISDPFFPRVNPWMVALCGSLVVLFGFLALAVCLFRMRGKLNEEIGTHLQKIYELQREIEWRKSAIHPENLTVDRDTANSFLIVSEDRKNVRRAGTRQNMPDNPERFDSWSCALGCEVFTSGRHYWEVEVVEGQFWAAGIARQSVRRNTLTGPNTEEGIWAVEQCGSRCHALTAPRPTPLSLNQVPKRMRVFLDIEGGWVAFFDADTEDPIFTFPPVSFTGEGIRPWLWLGVAGSQLQLCH